MDAPEHPNIATAPEGEPLQAFLDRAGSLPVHQGVALAAQLLSALAHAHARGQVHGRLGMDHLHVRPNGRLALSGFGAAPADATPAGDLRAAARIAYRLIAGTWPVEPPPLHELRAGLPAALDGVFDRALARNAEWPQDAQAFSLALQKAMGAPFWLDDAPRSAGPSQQPTAATRPADPPALHRTPPTLVVRAQRHRRGSRLRGAGAVLASLALALLAWRVGLPSPGSQQLVTQADAPAPAVAPPLRRPTPGPAVAALQSGPAARMEQAQPFAARQEQAQSSLVQPGQVGQALPPEHAPSVEARPVPLDPTPSFEARPQPADRADSVVPRSRPQDLPPPIEARPLTDASRVTAEARPATPDPSPSRRLAAHERQRHAVPQRQVAARSGVASTRAPVCRQDLGLARDLCLAIRCASAEHRRHPTCARLLAEQRLRDREFAQRERRTGV